MRLSTVSFMPVTALRFTSWNMIRMDPLGLGVTPLVDMSLIECHALLVGSFVLQIGVDPFESC